MGGGGLSNLFNHLQVMPAQKPLFKVYKKSITTSFVTKFSYKKSIHFKLNF